MTFSLYLSITLSIWIQFKNWFDQKNSCQAVCTFQFIFDFQLNLQQWNQGSKLANFLCFRSDEIFSHTAVCPCLSCLCIPGICKVGLSENTTTDFRNLTSKKTLLSWNSLIQTVYHSNFKIFNNLPSGLTSIIFKNQLIIHRNYK